MKNDNKWVKVQSQGWWMDPYGKLHLANKIHSIWAKQYLKSKNFKQSELDQPIHSLYQRGWVRVLFNGYSDGILHFGHLPEKAPNEKQMSVIKDLAIENQAIQIMDDTLHKEIPMLFENVKEIITEIVQESLSNDFTVLSGGPDKVSLNFWVDPNGKFIRIPMQGHNVWASQHIQNYPDRYAEKSVKMNPQNILYNENWIKVVLYDIHNEPILRIEYLPEIPPNRAQEKAMLDFVHEFNANPERKIKITHIQDDTKRTRKYINENIEPLNERLSFADLYDDTDDERIFKSKLPGMRVRSMDISMENGNETWNFNATSQEKEQYQRHGGKTSHKSRIIFFKDSVEPQDNAEDLECMVDCDCYDFKYRFAYVNAQDDASMIGGKSLNKAISRPPIKTNPEGHQQLCKHLAALTRYLVTNLDRARERAHLRPPRGAGNLQRPVNIFEAMNELANKGHDKWEYYDKDDSLNEGVERIGQDPNKQQSRMPINWNAPDVQTNGSWNENSIREFAGLPSTFQAIYRAILNVSDLDCDLGPSVCPEENDDIAYDWSEFRIRKNGFPPIVVMRDENKKLHIMDGNHRVHYAEEVGYQTIGAWIVDKFLEKHINQKSLQETRIITPEESFSEGYITLYHGTIWPLALKSKKGELGPQDMQKLVIDILVEVFHENPQDAKKYYDKYASIRKKDPARLFLTTSKKGAEGYARSCTKWGGEIFYDVISGYMYEKDEKIDRETLAKKLKTDEPALITINVPLEMVLTHPNWNTPLKHRLRDIMRNLKKYPDIKDSLFDNFNLEVFVKEKIPARFVQRIDKVVSADQE